MNWRVNLPDSVVPQPWASLRLSPRLAAVAEQVPVRARVADVGADHGLLSVALARSGRPTAVWAMDISRRAIQGAHRAVREAGVRVNVVESDGLAALEAGQVDVVIFAGLGGVRIAQLILRDRPVARGVRRLIVQPQSDWPHVRKTLVEASFEIVSEHLVVDGSRGYLIIVADNRPNAPSLTDRTLELGPCLLATRGPIFEAWLEHRGRYFEHRIRHAPHGPEHRKARIRLGWVRDELKTFEDKGHDG